MRAVAVGDGSGMKTQRRQDAAQIALVVTLSAFMGCAKGDRETCVQRPPEFEGEGPGYELIDLTRGGVWATRDWTPEAYAELSFPLAWKLWRKNDVRVSLVDRGEFRRSPGCEADGLFSYMQAFDRDFVQVVRLINKNQSADEQGLIRKIELEKHHILYFAAGRPISVLRSPEGEEYIGVSRTLNQTSAKPTLPAGWSLDRRAPSDQLHVELVGRVQVLRLDNEDSYQGPLPNGIL